MDKGRILYFYDALCGWCYGFSGVMNKVWEQYQNQFDFEVISGGMVLGEREGAIGKVAPYIKQAYRQVENHTGVKFGAPFLAKLDEGSQVFSSMPPAIAMSIVKEFAPSQAIPFASAIQRMIYFHGKSPEDATAYQQILAKLNISIDQLADKMLDPYYKSLAIKDFEQTATFGIRGFPSLVLVKNSQTISLLNGYQDYAYLSRKLDYYFQPT